MLIACIASLTASFVVSSLILFSKALQVHHFGDALHDSSHNVHNTPTPRIGGIAVFIGLVVGIMFSNANDELDSLWYLYFIACIGLIFVVGLVEDLTATLKPSIRLYLCFAISILAFFLLDARMLTTGIDVLDIFLLEHIWFSLLVSVLLIAGLTNAINMIDGLNGLMLFCMSASLVGLGLCAYFVGDQLILTVCVLLLAATLGLLIYNFPFGKIFAGDSGAYLLGFAIAIISLLLANRNANISSWCPVVILAYPISELLFTTFRRVLIAKSNLGLPDRMHLHSLLYRKLEVSKICSSKKSANYIASLVLWHFPVVSAVGGVYFYHHTASLVAMSLGLFAYYLLLYYLAISSFKKSS